MASGEEEGSIPPQEGGDDNTDTVVTRGDGNVERQGEVDTPPAVKCRRLSDLSVTTTSSDSGSSVITLKSIEQMPSIDPSKMDQPPSRGSAISPNPGRAFEIALLHLPSEGEMAALPEASLPHRPFCPVLRAESINGMDATASPATCAAVQGNAACATLKSCQEFRENGPSDVNTGAGPAAGPDRMAAAVDHPPEQSNEKMGGNEMESHDERPSEQMPRPGSAGEIAPQDRANEIASPPLPSPLNVTSKPREKILSSHCLDGSEASEVRRSVTLNPTDMPPPSNVVGNASFSNGSSVEMEKKSSSSLPRFRASSIKKIALHQDALPGEEIKIEPVRSSLTEKQQRTLRHAPPALTRYHTPPPHHMLLSASSGRRKGRRSKQDALTGMPLDDGEGSTDVHVVSLESGYTSHNEEACTSPQKLGGREVDHAPPPVEDVKQTEGPVRSAIYDHPEEREPQNEMGNREIQRRLSDFMGAFQDSSQRNWASVLSISPQASQGIVRSSSYTASIFKKRRSLDNRRSSDGSAPLVQSIKHLASTETLEQCPLCMGSPNTLAEVATRISQILLDVPNDGPNDAFPLPEVTSKPLGRLKSEETSPLIFLAATEVHGPTPPPVTTEVNFSPSPSPPLSVLEDEDSNLQEADVKTGFTPPCRADDAYLGNLLPGTIAPFAPAPLSWHRRVRSTVAWLGDYDDDKIFICSPADPSLALPPSDFAANATYLPKQKEKHTDGSTVSESTGEEDLLEGFYPGPYKVEREHRFSSGVVFILEREDCFACSDNSNEGGDVTNDVRRSRRTSAVPQVVPMKSPIICSPHNKEVFNQHSTLPIPQQDGGWQNVEDTDDNQGQETKKSLQRHSLSMDQYASLSLSSIYRPTSHKYAPDPNKMFCPITNVFRLRQHFPDSSTTTSDDDEDGEFGCDGGYKFSDYGWERE
ncbi:hypothetical protein TcYC6_0106600 [Trypanosoma cruzi]|nr:hypothetical protein TcYC6_0106600 [Trypanosoma cruzi]